MKHDNFVVESGDENDVLGAARSITLIFFASILVVLLAFVLTSELHLRHLVHVPLEGVFQVAATHLLLEAKLGSTTFEVLHGAHRERRARGHCVGWRLLISRGLLKRTTRRARISLRGKLLFCLGVG